MGALRRAYVRKELRLARIVEQSPALRHALIDQATDVESRIAIVEELFGAQLSAPALRIVSYAVRSGRIRDLVGTFDWLVALCAEERGRRVAQNNRCTRIASGVTE